MKKEELSLKLGFHTFVVLLNYEKLYGIKYTGVLVCLFFIHILVKWFLDGKFFNWQKGFLNKRGK